MVDIKVNTWSLNVALHRFIRGTQKDVALETQRQAKLLCLELASKASPRPKGVKGLAAAIPKIWGKRIRGQLGAIIKGAGGLRLYQLARLNDSTLFKNAYYPGKVTPQMRTVNRIYRNPKGETVGKQVTETSPLYRIMEAAKKDPDRALKNLRQILKNRLTGNVPTIYNNFMGRAVDAYYHSLKDKARRKAMGGPTGNVQKVFINTADPRPEREAQARLIEAQVGTVKSGWVQAGLAIPVKAGPAIPAWLRGKKSVGSGTVNKSTDRVGISLSNMVGNAGGMDDRTQYVNDALRSRTAKLVRGLEEALKAQARTMLKRSGQSIPAHLAPGNLAEINSIDE